MKYRKYVLTDRGAPEIVAFLAERVRREWPNLGEARRRGRAAKLLFGVDYGVKSVVAPRPVAERVKAL